MSAVPRCPRMLEHEGADVLTFGPGLGKRADELASCAGEFPLSLGIQHPGNLLPVALQALPGGEEARRGRLWRPLTLHQFPCDRFRLLLPVARVASRGRPVDAV